jgi:hypothetical protein
MDINFWIVFVAGIVPALVGGLWYSPLLFGNIWQKEVGLTDEQIKGANMPLVMGLSYVFSCFLAVGILGLGICIHEMGFMQLMAQQPDFDQPGSPANNLFTEVLKMAGGRHLSFGHGAFHGVLGGVLIAFPIIAIKSMFDQRSWKYIFLNAGYWIVTFALMGGLACQFGVTITVQ